MIVRMEQPGDAAIIADIVTAAFAGTPHGGDNEAAIVDRLRGAGALTLSLVAESNGIVAGHAAFSPVTIDGTDIGLFGLGPVAVHPDHQRQSAGGRMIRKGLQMLQERGAAGCVVLGDPAYYGRFGFAVSPGLIYPAALAHLFMYRALNGRAAIGTVRYHPAFDN